MSIAAVASQQNALATAANATASGSAKTAAGNPGATQAGATQAGQNALGQLSGNFQNFLKLLMTQLQNQDPTTPLDTNQFTTQLVQFAGVEQQINTNTSLTSLIQLTQGGEVLQSSAMVGRHVELTSDHLPLQGGQAEVKFTAPVAGQVAVAIYNDSGTQIADALVDAKAGANSWTWNGKSGNGQTVADGSYRVAVVGANAGGTATALPFTVVGVATGVEQEGSAVKLRLGAQTADFTAVKSVID